MSHNVRLQNIEFTNLEILAQAVAELAKETNQPFELVKTPTTIRGWGGRPSQVDAAIKCPNQSYDIGFTRKGETYSPYLESDFSAPGITPNHTAQTIEGQSCAYSPGYSSLGRLQQRYGVIEAETQARRIGALTRRITTTDGQIQLEVMTK